MKGRPGCSYNTDELIHIDRTKFAVVDTPRNRELQKERQ